MQRTGGSGILSFVGRCAPAADRPYVMPPNPPPSSAREAYKAVIDALVEDSGRNVCDRSVREDGVYRKADGYSEANALVASLSQEQRRVLAEILLDQRKSAI